MIYAKLSFLVCKIKKKSRMFYIHRKLIRIPLTIDYWLWFNGQRSMVNGQRNNSAAIPSANSIPLSVR